MLSDSAMASHHGAPMPRKVTARGLSSSRVVVDTGEIVLLACDRSQGLTTGGCRDMTVSLKKKRATIRDVGRRALVSHQTVSRVINGELSIAPATRARVERAIAELGFRPNHVARSLA